MAQWVRQFADKPDDLSWIPDHKVEETWFLQVVLWPPPHTCFCICAHITFLYRHSHTINVINFLKINWFYFLIIIFAYLFVHTWGFAVYPVWLHPPETLNLDILLPQFRECWVIGMCNRVKTLGVISCFQILFFHLRLTTTLPKDDLDFCILLPLLPKYWDDKSVHPMICVVLGLEPRGLVNARQTQSAAQPQTSLFTCDLLTWFLSRQHDPVALRSSARCFANALFTKEYLQSSRLQSSSSQPVGMTSWVSRIRYLH